MGHRAKHRAAARKPELPSAWAGLAAQEMSVPDVAPPPPKLPRGGHGPGGLEEMILHGLQHKPTYPGGKVGDRVAGKRAKAARRFNRKR